MEVVPAKEFLEILNSTQFVGIGELWQKVGLGALGYNNFGGNKKHNKY